MAYRGARRMRVYRASRDKYSIENTGFTITPGTSRTNELFQGAAQIVAPSTIQGMRKVKHLRINLTDTLVDSSEFYWAIVYVPQGTSVNSLFAVPGEANGSLYEPNQFVMACGIVDPTAGPIRFSSRLSRNLNSGDSVWLVVGSTAMQAQDSQIRGVVSYAITLQ